MRRLVCCLDGTWNTPDQAGNPTNVTAIMRAIRPVDDAGVNQVVFYDKGVGTGGWINRLRGGALGRGLGENVRDAYRFLVNNHQPGDEIYVFGFSRGAFTARSLCGMIGAVGLLADERHATTEDAWAAYRMDRDDPERSARIEAIGAPRVRIRLVGVWDTVGALGIPNDWFTWKLRGKYAFHDVALGHAIDHAFHALAIDERRGPFVPTLWRLPPGESLPATDGKHDPDAGPVTEQVWFPGVHSDIGGGYDEDTLARLPLDWMIRRARDTTELAFHDDPVAAPDPLAPAHESRTWAYLVSRALPMLRVIGGLVPDSGGRLWARAKHRQSSLQEVAVNEFVHRAALDRWGRDAGVIGTGGRVERRRYEPPNLGLARERLPVVEHDGTITRTP